MDKKEKVMDSVKAKLAALARRKGKAKKEPFAKPDTKKDQI